MKQRDMAPLPPPGFPIAAPGTAGVPEAASAAVNASGSAAPALSTCAPLLNAPLDVPPGTPEPARPAGGDKGLPMPNGAAMRKAALDLLYENVRESPSAADKDRIGAPAARPWRDRRLGRLLPQGLAGEPDEAAQEAGAADGMLIAGAAMATAGTDFPVMPGGRNRLKPGGAPARRAGPGAAWMDDEAPPESGDRLHRIAVVADTYIQPLRPPRMNRPGSLPPLRPKSKAECERRCGSDGFCDPSNLLGCGGMHCGKQRDLLY